MSIIAPMKIHELGHVVLYVTNLKRCGVFYRDVLGFKEVGSSAGMIAFSSGRTHHELLLIEIGGKPLHKEVEPGLYHIGFKIGNSQAELRTAYQELEQAGVEIVGTSDHTVSKSIYCKDPDGNEIELYVDVSDGWKKDPKLVLSTPKRLEW